MAPLSIVAKAFVRLRFVRHEADSFHERRGPKFENVVYLHALLFGENSLYEVLFAIASRGGDPFHGASLTAADFPQLQSSPQKTKQPVLQAFQRWS